MRTMIAQVSRKASIVVMPYGGLLKDPPEGEANRVEAQEVHPEGGRRPITWPCAGRLA